jgi:signal transduction histidine kinase
MSWATRATVALAGAAATLLASLTLQDSLPKALELAATAGGAAVAAGLVGAAALHASRRRSFALQSAVAALTAVAAVAAGAMAASRLMMDASRPIAALGVVLASSGTIAVLISLALGSRVRIGSESLIEATRQIGGGDRVQVRRPPAGELAALARELETMQAQLEESAARARRSEDARRELVAWISHDLRTPLGRIRAIVEALEDGILSAPGDVSAYYGRLRAEADRLGVLVGDLFELNRISAGSLELELEATGLADVVSDVVASFAVVADARGVTLRALRPPEDPAVRVSAPHFERALGNLIDNAIRCTPPGGAIDVDVARDNGFVAVGVADGCGGSDVHDLERALGGHAGGEGPKTGLGLAIAKGLVEAQGGRIAVRPTERGCRFTLTLPVARP